MDAAPPPLPPPVPSAAAPGPPPLPVIEPPVRAGSALRAWLFQFFLPLLVGAGLLGGLLSLSGYLKDRRTGERHIAFTDIECDPPPGMTRQQFLAEVQYLVDMPDRLNLLEPEIHSRIADALASHPWVAQVRRVELLPAGGIRVDLDQRQPVLAVADPARVVDGAGILLPSSTPRAGLPVLTETVGPAGLPGRSWGDSAVQTAAPVAALLGPHLKELKFVECRVAVTGGEVVLRASDRRVVLWGRAPGKEQAGEAAAAVKLRRLLQAPPKNVEECDLRPTAGVKRRSLRPVTALAR